MNKVEIRKIKMETIQIAPYKKDCTISGSKITGTMDGRTFVYELPNGLQFNTEDGDGFIGMFQQAIALCSKQWQVTELLNSCIGVQGGRFYEQ